MEAALGEQSASFFAALEAPAPVSILKNKYKDSAELLYSQRPVPWCPFGHYLESRPEFIFEPAFHAGAYYVMEASSMMLWQGLSALFESSNGLRILDLCGAPGGKSMVASNFLGENSLLVINEVNRSRYAVLKENVAKWGAPNIYTSNYDPSKISLDDYFDCVIVDAPCSGEGLFRKTPEAINSWSASNVTHCSMRQKRILKEAARLVRPGGFLLYSTCTYNSEENVLNTAYIADNIGFSSIQLKLKFKTIEQYSEHVYGYQCYPHLVEGEGFYLSALQKGGEELTRNKHAGKSKFGSPTQATKKEIALWRPYLKDADAFKIFINEAGTFYAIPRDILDQYIHVLQALPHGSPSIILGQIKGTDIVPHHSLALSSFVSDALPQISLTAEEAISYLRKDSIADAKGASPGWHLAVHDRHILGWMKQTSRQLKNYFPTNLRIRKRR